MSEQTVRARIASVLGEGSWGGSQIWRNEMDAVWADAESPEAGDPAGKPVTVGEAKALEELASAGMSRRARETYNRIIADLPALTQSTPSGTVVTLSKKSGDVFITSDAGFAADALGALPADAAGMTQVLYEAGGWIQQSFGTADNLFARAALTLDGKRAVLAQVKGFVATDLADLSHQQVDQFLGAAAASLIELHKSVDSPALASPSVAEQNRQLRAEIFTVIREVLDHARMNVRIRRALAGYMHKSASFQAKLEPAHKADLAAVYAAHHPQAPFDYAKWDADNKSIIHIDHACGEGEGFYFGYVKQLMERGLSRFGNDAKYAMQLVQGDKKQGPALLRVVVPSTDPMNAWGRDMTVEIKVREFKDDMYAAMSDPSVDIVSYGGHSNFGGNTLASLDQAPAQVGDKVIVRDLCAGIDTTNAEARLYPDASDNSITSVNSSYFRTTDDPTVGQYVYESEGYTLMMVLVRGVLAKKKWMPEIANEVTLHANWPGVHDSANNWMLPGDPRRDGARDDNGNGIPNVFDVMPAVDTTDVAASTYAEFELAKPSTPAASLGAGRAFQALQFVNTATNYNSDFAPINAGRKLVPSPQGLWFDADEAPSTYARMTRTAANEIQVQLSSALADMSMEATRTVLYFEAARFFAREKPTLFATQEERVAMALLFTASSLVYDQAWRDSVVFHGLRNLYGIPQSVDWAGVEAVVLECEQRHTYTGDRLGVQKLVAAYGPALAGAGVGEPAVTVTV